MRKNNLGAALLNIMTGGWQNHPPKRPPDYKPDLSRIGNGPKMVIEKKISNGKRKQQRLRKNKNPLAS